MKKINYLLLTSILALTLISCGEENETHTTTYTPQNAEITTPTRWKATDSILVDCILEVHSTLTIEPGTIIKFTENGGLTIGGRKNGALLANGTAEKPIRFTTTLYTPADSNFTAEKGSWYGLSFRVRNQPNTTSLKHCIFEGGSRETTTFIEIEETTLKMESCIIRDCAGIGINTKRFAGFTTFSHNEISRCDSYLLCGEPEALVNLDTTNTLLPTNNKGIALQGGTLSFDCTLTKQTIPYTLLDHLYIEESALTIEKGTTLHFAEGKSLNIGKSYPAALIAIGTATEPIHLTSAASNPQPGDWQGLVFHTNTISTRTNLQYITLDYAGKSVGTYEGAIHTFSPIRMENSTIQNSKTYGIYSNEGIALTAFTNNTIQDCSKHPVSIHVNQAHTLQPTNNYTNNTYNSIQLRGATVTGNITWQKLNVPYHIEESLIIGDGTTQTKLTIAPGCTLALSLSSIIVNGNGILSAIGTPQDSITFTTAAEIPEPGDWISISFEAGCSPGNTLSYCTVEYAGDFSTNAIGINSSNVSITHSTIRNSLLHGIYLYYNEPANTPTLSDNAFSGNPGDDIHYESQPE